MINSRSFEQVVFCNFCHERPATGWIEVDDEEGKAARAICKQCLEELP